ncbi:MAG TPA: NAD(P)-dependent oxidoreductase [Mucilaginibacter sp.]|jgi:nucleoside-diphosphate-sugar epimerase|nr:NAD(P)-dependent oxidoreductase [Mucilaginibacter sp.]
MRVLVTGSAGHLGEALVRTLVAMKYEVVGIDILKSPFTTHQGSIIDRSFIKSCLDCVKIVFHAASLHKPHIVTHSPQQFVDINITGTLNLLEECVIAGIERFVFTSTTSVFGDALVPPAGASAAWVDENVTPVPKNIYGVTKAAAEDLCQLFHRNHGLACIVLRTSRFFPEEDDNKGVRQIYTDCNLKANEYLFRRVDLEDAVNAHILTINRATAIGFGKYIISATTPFLFEDMKDLRTETEPIIRRLIPEYEMEYKRRGWKMFPAIDRVYINERARNDLGWQPQYDFKHIIDRLKAGDDLRSPLARIVGNKGYHAEKFLDGPYPVK